MAIKVGPPNGLVRQTKTINFTSGLNTKGDKRAQPENLLDIAQDVSFATPGSIELRYPYENPITAIEGGGTIANPRKLAALGNEKLLFTRDALYSLDQTASKWVYRGDHPA